jgi:hypothetical protein
MAGTIVSKKILDRLREVFKRYGNEVLGDPDITVDFFSTDYEGSVGVLLTSPRFQNMLYSERQDSVWDYLLNNPQVNKDDMFVISRISMEPEAVEFV